MIMRSEFATGFHLQEIPLAVQIGGVAHADPRSPHHSAQGRLAGTWPQARPQGAHILVSGSH
jgi:hypothetical protein